METRRINKRLFARSFEMSRHSRSTNVRSIAHRERHVSRPAHVAPKECYVTRDVLTCGEYRTEMPRISVVGEADVCRLTPSGNEQSAERNLGSPHSPTILRSLGTEFASLMPDP